MACDDIIARLTKHGCADLTDQLDQAACSDHPIANGGLGDVFRGKLVNGASIAIKTIRMYAQNDNSPAGTFQKRAAKEIYAWSKCDHPNVVHLEGLATFRGTLAMISYWEANGNLSSYLSRNRDADRCQLSIEICAGLLYLHENDIVHGDLKGANVLIAEDGRPMLMDFGNARFQEATLQFTQTTKLNMTPRWTAPEILEGKSAHTLAGDIYSLGMTILETLTGEPPFAVIRNDQAIMMHVAVKKKTPTRPKEVIPETSIYGNILWAILMSCWAYDPRRRPTAECVCEAMKPLTSDRLRPIEDEPEEGEAMDEA